MPVEPQDLPALSCRECLNEIPQSVASSLEGPDYVHYYCGLECYDTWQARKDNSPSVHPA